VQVKCLKQNKLKPKLVMFFLIHDYLMLLEKILLNTYI